MNLSAAQIFWGLMILLGGFYLTIRVQPRERKVLAAALGISLAGLVLFLPVMVCLYNSPPIPTDTEILRLLYGPGASIQTNPDGSAYIVEELSEIEKEQFQYAAQVNTQIAHQVRNWEGNPKVLIVLTRTSLPDCCERALSPVLGGARLHWEDDRWQVDSYQKLMIPYARFDLLPETSILEIGPEKNALVLTDDPLLARGFQTQQIILAVVDGQLKPVAEIATLANNANLCPPLAETEPCWEYEVAYKFIRGDQPEYFDLRVITEGTKLVNGNLVGVNETTYYTFMNGEFQSKGQ
ncbi:MAG TPA: hypothetical protein DEH25_01880 [Chloroflexi bacterium]|nr:hypothetical protein [Chloroflexota bacterium]HBY08481.1 hypothetical protein [Chloroflexota bacterium]